MSGRIVYFNGRIVPESEARISIYDSALLMGDMAFEVTRTCRHVPFRLREHLSRLAGTLDALSIHCGLSLGELECATLETLARNLPTEAADVDWNIIHNVSRGPGTSFREAFAADELRPTVVIGCYPLHWKMAGLAAAYRDGIDHVVPAQRSPPHPLYDASLKTRSRLHYQLANLQAAAIAPGATAVLVDPDGWLTEATSGNLFAVQNGKLTTPAGPNLLPGVTRSLVLELAAKSGIDTAESRIAQPDAARADELFITSTSVGILHARSFEGQQVGGGAIGPLTARLRGLLHDAMGIDLVAQAAEYAHRLSGA